MEIFLKNLGKRFNRETLFTNINYNFTTGNPTAIIGSNGSGKSTLLQIIAGNLLPSMGNVEYKNKATIEVEEIYKFISFSAPYLELIEEFTLKEQLEFHFKYKTPKEGEDLSSIIEKGYFEQHQNKQIKNFSSGMKQRVKLLLALFSETQVLLLDEPTSYLDEKGVEWYNSLIKSNVDNRLVILASNQKSEYNSFNNILDLNNFK